MKILIVDDNAQVRRIIRYAVRALATQIIECSDGDEVLALYAQHLPDIVLMDIHMPRVDGLTATKASESASPGSKRHHCHGYR
jgi:CheY-like chemotaxis protein